MTPLTLYNLTAGLCCSEILHFYIFCTIGSLTSTSSHRIDIISAITALVLTYVEKWRIEYFHWIMTYISDCFHMKISQDVDCREKLCQVSQVKSSLLYCQFFHMYSTYIQRIEIALFSDPWCIQLTLNTDSRRSNTDKYSLTICTYKLYRYTNEDIVEK